MTEYNNNYEREFGWDDTITQDSSFVLLDPGEYWFTVEKFERARHTPNPNSQSKNPLPPCNKAVLTLVIETNDGQTKKLNYNLFLHSRTEGMISAFFGAIGQKKHGESLRMNWQMVPGAVGVAQIKKSTSSKGNEFNEVGYMIYSEDVDDTKQLNARPNQGNYSGYQNVNQPSQAQQPTYQQVPYQHPGNQHPVTPQANGFQPGTF